jgi:hypothetical protein
MMPDESSPECSVCFELEGSYKCVRAVHSIQRMLEERGKRYGSFVGHAELTQELKTVMSIREGWKNLTSDQREALEMIAHKIGRIINGDPNYIDSWQDIIGYAQLVKDRLEKEF